MIFSISVSKREGGRAGRTRAGKTVPGVLYGSERKSVSISVDKAVFEKLYNEAGESSLIDLTLEGESTPVKVLIQEVQYDPVKDMISHVDFRQINMNVEMYATIELEFLGESPAMKELGGTLTKGIESVEVKCLPKYLVGSIAVDVSKLQTFEDMIRIKDLVLPEGIKVVNEPEILVAKIVPPLTEEQMKAMEEEGQKGIDSIEVEKKGKKEEEGAEGAEDKTGAAPAGDAKKSGDVKKDEGKKE